ncbi:MAG TPA: protein kinase [Steroidobacteraceae bacterium]|nr:protein kinase [Steroidobacteraceae bacterium]
MSSGTCCRCWPEMLAGCSVCGSSAATQIDGLCAACLIRVAAEPAEIADNFGNYELLEEIARGGMGIVYRARQLSLDRVVGLKMLLPQLAEQVRMRDRFRREAEAVAKLDHPGILPVYEVGVTAGLPWFSMKLAEGGGLDARIDSLAGRWREIAELVVKLADAVEHAHERGILHRDLKPANILFDSHGAPMIADFGLARLGAANALLTMPATTLGSPNYMAPEQVSAEFGDLGPRTDVYGLGGILYQLLTGKPPVQGEDAVDTLRRVPTHPPPPGSQTRPDIPGDLETIARKCLAKRPEERYAGAAEVAADLRRWLDGQPALVVRERRRRLAGKWTALVSCGAAAAALVSWLIMRTPESATATVASPAQAPRSVGVVPFRNVSGDPRDDGLTTLVTDDLVRDLRQVKSLDVLPFRVAADATGDADPAKIAAQIGVEMLLLGEVARDNDGVHVQARLWDARVSREVWRHDFATSEHDLRELRAQIAEALVTGLQLEVGADWQGRMAPGMLTRSPEAYRKYLRARYLLRWRRQGTVVEAARELKAAIALDPDFAQAHSALAAVYALWPPAVDSPDGDPRALSEQAARDALALNGKLAEPHAVLGRQAMQRGEYLAAEDEYQKAMAADPYDPSALHFYAIHLYGVGRLGDALEIERRSVALDATSAQPMMWLAMLTTLRGEREDAMRLWQKSEELGATRPLSAAIVRLELDQPQEIRAWYHNRSERVGLPEQLDGEDTLIDGLLDPAKRAEAIRWMRRVEKQLDPAFAITHYAMLEDADDAYRIASRYDLSEDRYYLLKPTNLWAPRTAALRRDARFATLAEKWGLAGYWRKVAPADRCEVTVSDIHCR